LNPNIPFVPKGIVYKDREEKLRLESRNGVIQAEFVIYSAATWNENSRFTPDLLRETQRLAVNQIYRCAGHFRDGSVILDGGTHKPPDFSEVPGLVDEMCAYVNGSPVDAPAVH
jgi:hypothetical protein